jgi:glycosyltransferase involved in cell wall biosynthesis
VKVLYVNHTAQVSGAERTLLDLLAGTPPGVCPIVACPDGPLADHLRELQIEVRIVPGTSASLRMDLRNSVGALSEFARTARVLREIVASVRPDLVHANTIRSGLAMGTCGLSLSPLITHIHDHLPPGLVPSGALRAVALRSKLLFACSRYVAGRMPAMPHKVRVVHNPVDPERFRPGLVPSDVARARLGIPGAGRVLGLIAQITPWKAQDDALRVLALLRRRFPETRLVLVGSAKFTSGATRFDNRSYARRLDELIDSLGVREGVLLLGERPDVPEILCALDVLLVPSWQEPFGRSMIEAMATGLPVVATSVGGPPEVIDDGVNGYLRPPRQPEAWAMTVSTLLEDDALRERVGTLARRRVTECFSTSSYEQRVVAGYCEALSGYLARSRRIRPRRPPGASSP